jgi:hypothetical protein
MYYKGLDICEAAKATISILIESLSATPVE